MTRIALVSGSDANYYALLREWVHSVQRFPESKGMDICIIDAGLSDAQRAELHGLGVKTVRPDWPQGIRQEKVKGKEYLKACVCRPFIPDIFPGYDVYMWMDSDTWVQEWRGVQTFIDAALEKKDKLVITNECNRNRDRQVRISWLWRWPWKVKNFYYNNCLDSFGFEIARKLLSKYVMSAGCFAIHASAPHWKGWQKLIVQGLDKGKVFTAEQASLGVLVYHEGYKVEILPVYLHWHCDVDFAYDTQTKKFIEPSAPHEPIGIVHMSGVDHMRGNRNVTHAYATRQGGVIEMNCRYPFFNAGEIGAPPKRA